MNGTAGGRSVSQFSRRVVHYNGAPHRMTSAANAPALARKLRLFDYFTLSFGTMIGAGWLVLMDDWLARGGPGAVMLGFTIGGVALVPIGYVYGKLVRLIP